MTSIERLHAHFRAYRLIAMLLLAITVVFLAFVYPSLPALMAQNFHIDGSFRGFSSKVHLWILPACAALMCFVAYKDSQNKQKGNREMETRSPEEYRQDMLSATWFAAALGNLGLLNLLYIYIANALDWWYPDVGFLFVYPIVIFIGMVFYFTRSS